MKPRMILVSGPRGAGKTTLLQKTLAALAPRNLDVSGILSRPVVEQGIKVAIDGQDLRTRQVRRLAELNPGRAGQLDTRQWSFDPQAMRWADDVLARACPCDLLVVDELGVLEFERGLGWQSGLRALDEGPYRLALAVIRPELLTAAQVRWPAAEVEKVPSISRPPDLPALLRKYLLQ